MEKKAQIQRVSLYFINLIVPFFISLLIIFFIPFDIPYKILFGFIIGIIVVLISMKFNLELNLKKKISLRRNSELFFAIIYLILIIFNIITNLFPYDLKVYPSTNLLSNIPFFLMSSLITAFMPGYSIIKIFKIGKFFSNLEKILYAIILSILISSFSGYIAWNMGDLANYSDFIIIGINLSILFIFFLFLIKKKLKKESTPLEIKNSIKIDLVSFGILAFITFFVILSYFIIHQKSGSPLLILGDEYGHVGYIVKLMRNLYSWQESSLNILATPTYPYFFHLFQSVNISLSNLSVIDSYILSSIYLLPLPMLAFYSLAKQLSKSKKTSVLAAVIFQIFSGFGWMFAVSNFGAGNEYSQILSVSYSTCDIIFSTWFPTINAPYLIDITAFLFIINLSVKKKIKSNYLFFLILPLMLLSELTHFVNIFFLTIFMIGMVFIEIFFEKKIFCIKELGLALMTSIFFIFLLDVVSIMNLFTSYPPLSTSLLICGMSGLFIFLVSIVRFNSINFLKNFKKFLSSNSKKILLIYGIFFVGIFFYEIIFRTLPKSHCSFIPLYYLPLKLGYSGLFLIMWGLSISNAKKKEDSYLLFLLLILVGGEILFYHLPVLSAYTGNLGLDFDEFRFFRDMTWPFVSIAAGMGVKRIIEKVRRLKKMKTIKKIHFFLLFFIIIGQAPISHLLKIEYMSNLQRINEKDKNIVNYISTMKVKAGSSIYAPHSLKDVINSLTGVPIYTEQTPIYGNIISTETSYPSLLFTLRYLNISYLIISENEKKLISSNIYNHFPIIYEDGNYKIYKLPNFSYPNFYSGNTMLLGDNQYPEISVNTKIYRQNYLWIDDFKDYENWELDYSTLQNVIFHSIKLTNSSTVLINCEGKLNSKIVMFYKYMFEKPIHVKSETYLLTKFRTREDTCLLVNLLYNDGTMSNSYFDGSIYMTSKSWGWSKTLINYANKTIVGLRIGITNFPDNSINKIWAELDYLVISKLNNSCFRDGIMALSLSNVDYNIEYNTAASFVEENYENIILTDNIISSEIHTYLIKTLLKTKNVIILGDLSDSDWVLNYTDLIYNEESILINKIEFNDVNYSFPSINVPNITLEKGNSIAWYSSGVKIPLILNVSINSTLNFYYVNIWPIIEAIKKKETTEDLFSYYDILKEIFTKKLNLTRVNHIERAFYQKSESGFSINGNTKIECLNPLIFTNSFQEFKRYGGKYTFEANGIIEIFSLSYGLCFLIVKGNITFQEDNIVLIKHEDEELLVSLKVKELYGEAKINFIFFSSSFPYKLSIAKEPYKTKGKFQMKLFPISTNLLFILPNKFTGGWWRTIEH